ncbi:hypothetical protein [Cohnella mopanensis]|uniref:hypothetical protein n=1 Tax=Cohnella mopanensis TaxID=2911966 RepID=UPI001EF8F3E1|nr:hypothetical protein [Cohnella mopanensis]
MGVCKIDRLSKLRELDARYRMETADGVKSAISEAQQLESGALKGTYENVNLLVDIQSAIEECEFNPEEIHAIQVAMGSGVIRWENNVAFDSAAEKLAAVFRGWRYDSGEVAA